MARPASYGELLNEFAGQGPLAGVLLQELAVAGAKPKILSDNGSVCKFETTLQDCSPNRNKRLYSEDVLSSAIGSPSVQEKLRTRTMFGEANHPFTEDLKRQMVVDRTRISHLNTELSPPRGGVVRGTVETAATRSGRDFRGLIVENGSTAAFSMRGMGAVRRVPGKDLIEVTKPMALIAYDSVDYPSHPSAYMDTMHEHVAFVGEKQATDYAMDQSQNVRALVEQFELSPDSVSLTEDQAAVIVRSGRSVVAAFLERDIRMEFRRAILGR